MTRTLRGFARIGLAACLAAGLLGDCSCTRAKRLNVLLITLDTTRADALGSYGGTDDPTPNLDRIAREGTRFDLAISTAAVTPVSHASILTGLDNKDHGLRVLSAPSGFRLAADAPSIATLLKREGYQTAAIHSAFPVSAYFGLDQGFDIFESFDAVMDAGQNGHTWNVVKLQRRSDETTNRVIEYLDRKDDPFLLWVHYWDPHDGVRVPPAEFLPPNLPRNERGELVYDKRWYAAEVHYMDHEIGRLVRALEQRGEWENTLVVVVADHGEGLGDHGWEHHRILYQEQIRVPLIVRIPGVAQPASIEKLVRTTDIAPTILDYLGVAGGERMRGKSLRALFEARDEPERVAFADQINGYDLNASMLNNRPLDDFLYCVIRSGWKLIYRPTHPAASELYDLAHDPREATNLFTVEVAQARALETELARHAAWVTAPFAPIPDANLAQAQKALGGLGYTASENALLALDALWAWTCPSHPDQISVERQACPLCGSAPLLIARPR